MSVAELLNNLIELQEVDKAIFDFKKQLAEIPAKLKGLDSEIEAVALKVKQSGEELKRTQLEHKDKEIDLAEKENGIKKYRAQLYQVKTNAEYSALEKEIGGLMADKSILEEEILVMFDKIEAAEKIVREGKATLDEKKKKVETEKVEINLEKEKIEKEVAGLNEKRGVITPLIDKKTLSRYERILHNKEGVALVPIKGENCGGCFVNIPPQVINEIRLKDNIIYCDRCARMLYTGK